MTPVGDTNIPHEADVDKAIDAQMRRTSTQVHIPNAVAAVGSTPTKAEFDAVVTKFNLVLGTLRDAELLPSS